MTTTELRAPTTSPPRGRRALDQVFARRLRGRTVFIIGTVIVLLYLVLGPIVMMVGSSVQENKAGLPFSKGTTWTFANYRAVFSDSETYHILGVTLVFALGSLALATAISLALSWLLERTDLPLRNALFVGVVAPSGVPLLIMSISWSLLLSPRNGVLNSLLHHVGVNFNAYSLPGMILVQAMGMVPLTFLLITGSMRAMNGVLEDAADACGANRATILRKITLPLLTPALMAALIYQFVNSVENVDVPLVLGLPGHIHVLSTEIYTQTHPLFGLPAYGLSSTYGLLLTILAIGPLIIYDRVLGGAHGRYATITGRVRRPKVVELGRWRYPIFFVVLAYLGVSFWLPALILVWASAQPFYSGVSVAAWHKLTLSGWRTIWHSGSVGLALKNTVVLGVVTSIATMILALFIAWVVVRSKARGAWIVDVLAFVPHAIPGVVIGLSVLILYLLLPLPIFGSIWVVVIAQTTLFVSLGSRLMCGSLAQTQACLEEAAAASGAPMRKIWGRVVVPLIRPAFVNGCLLVFMASMQNLTLPLMLASSNNTVLSSLIWARWNYGLTTQAAVLSVVMMAITVTVAALLRGVGGRSGKTYGV